MLLLGRLGGRPWDGAGRSGRGSRRRRPPDATGPRLPHASGPRLPDATGRHLPDANGPHLPDANGRHLPQGTFALHRYPVADNCALALSQDANVPLPAYGTGFGTLEGGTAASARFTAACRAKAGRGRRREIRARLGRKPAVGLVRAA